MTTVQAPVSDMLVTVKSREVQRALLAEQSGERDAAVRHFLAVSVLGACFWLPTTMASTSPTSLAAAESARLRVIGGQETFSGPGSFSMNCEQMTPEKSLKSSLTSSAAIQTAEFCKPINS